jgi:hypothetical protein
MTDMASISFYLVVVGGAWLFTILLISFWLYKKLIPEIKIDMKASGFTEKEIEDALRKVSFPPRFYK